MNAAMRAVVRAGLDRGCETFGVWKGYTGLMSGEIVSLGARSVGGIIQQGGTILGSTRCEEFRTEAGRRRALTCLEHHDIDGLIVIGGNGSQRGA
jgi:6-phosphofructokinase 1